jgi:hypothetical protein
MGLVLELELGFCGWMGYFSLFNGHRKTLKNN